MYAGLVAPAVVDGASALLTTTHRNWWGRKDGSGMKNTGKRIFAAIVFAVLVSLPVIGTAGVLYSQR